MTMYIHIGYGKTGSSALQSFFAKHKDQLKENNIIYPDHQSFLLAKKGWVSSGNGSMLIDKTFEIDSKKSCHYLFSSEHLGGVLKSEENFIELITRFGNDIAIICYCRDLFEHYISTWGQYIKRGGGTKNINEYSSIYGGFYKDVLNCLQLAEKFKIKFYVRNYSRHKSSLVNSFLEVLNLDVSGFDVSSDERQVVNRSLTISEYTLQTLFNKYFEGRSSSFISDPLVNRLPGLYPEIPFISDQTYNDVIKWNIDIINKINLLIPEEERILVSPYESLQKRFDRGESKLVFTYEQLDILVNSISNKMNKKLLLDEDATRLRDISLKFDTEELLNLNDAKYLMSLANKARPNGGFILKKLKEYQSIIKSKLK